MATTVRKTARTVAVPAAKKTSPARRAVPAPKPVPKPAAAVAVAVPASGTKPAKPPKAPKPAKPRVKLVRDSFTMPEADIELIAQLKARALEARRPARKSELLRAGLHALTSLGPVQLVAALDALIPVKTGRPKKGH